MATFSFGKLNLSRCLETIADPLPTSQAHLLPSQPQISEVRSHRDLPPPRIPADPAPFGRLRRSRNVHPLLCTLPLWQFRSRTIPLRQLSTHHRRSLRWHLPTRPQRRPFRRTSNFGSCAQWRVVRRQCGPRCAFLVWDTGSKCGAEFAVWCFAACSCRWAVRPAAASNGRVSVRRRRVAGRRLDLALWSASATAAATSTSSDLSPIVRSIAIGRLCLPLRFQTRHFLPLRLHRSLLRSSTATTTTSTTPATPGRSPPLGPQRAEHHLAPGRHQERVGSQ